MRNESAPFAEPADAGEAFLEKDQFFCDNVASVIRGARFDLCMSHDVFALPAAAIVAEASGALLWYDITDVPDLSGRLGASLRELPSKVIAAFADRVEPLIASAARTLTVGPSLGGHAARTYDLDPEPVVVRNVRAFERPAEDRRIRADACLDDDAQLVLYVNLAARGYGVEDLITALALLPEHVHVAVLGRVGLHDHDEYARELNDLARGAGVTHRMHFLDPVGPDQVPAYASGADMAVITLPLEVPNARMALPNRFFDAVMARLPLATVPIADVSSLLEAYAFGMTFPPNDPAELAAAVGEVLDPRRLPILRENAARAATELCWEREEQRLLDVVDEFWEGDTPMRICIVARKNVAANLRIMRQCRTLLEAGHQVAVMAVKPPAPEDVCMVPGVRYVRVIQGARISDTAAVRLRDELRT